MKILLFEWFTGGGDIEDDCEPEAGQSLLAEGWKMIGAMARDLAAVGHDCKLLLDSRFSNELRKDQSCQLPVVQVTKETPWWEQLARLSHLSDAILIVAPETGGRLVQAIETVPWSCRDRLLNPGVDAVRVGSSKTTTADRLASAGIAVPMGARLDRLIENAGLFADRPCVVKLDDGCGSDRSVRLPCPPQDSGEFTEPEKWRIEELVPGLPCSVIGIGSRNGRLAMLPPVGQIFSRSSPESFSERNWPGPWSGATYPLPAAIAERATRLARRAFAALPKFVGCGGIDLVLGDTPDAPIDYVIEFNPRLTTSWAELCQHANCNLAQFMIEWIVSGERSLPEFSEVRRG